MNSSMRLGTAGIAILVLPFAALSETAEVRILKGESAKKAQVVETRYGNGECTVCNYGERAYKLDGRTFVPPMGYVLCGD